MQSHISARSYFPRYLATTTMASTDLLTLQQRIPSHQQYTANMMLSKAAAVLLGTAALSSSLKGAAGADGAAAVPLEKGLREKNVVDISVRNSMTKLKRVSEALGDEDFYLSLLRGTKGDSQQVNSIKSSVTASKKIRRDCKLGTYTSQDASKADCGTSLDIQLYDGSSVLEFHPSGGSCHTGKRFSGATNDGSIVVTLVPGYNEGSFHAVVTNEETGIVYSIAPNAKGEMMVSERHQTGFGREIRPVDANTLNEGFDPLETSLNDQIKNATDASTLDTELSTIDVLVLWTTDAECRNANETRGCTITSNTTAAMRGTIDIAIEITNEAYKESGIHAEVNLVYAYLDHTYQETAGEPFMPALEHVAKKGDGRTDKVHEFRELYGADIVAMIIDDENDNFCGKAYIGPRRNAMFSVIRWDCAAAVYSFGHELSHTMGANHDRAQGNKCTDSSTSAYAYRDPDGKFRSLMAYECIPGECDHTYAENVDCTRVKRFSNTNYMYNSKPIGDDEDNNAGQINKVREEVAGYFNRTRVVAISDLGKCLEASNETNKVHLSDCKLDNTNQVFEYDPSTQQVILNGRCLEYSLVDVQVAACHAGNNQKWSYDRTSQSLKNLINQNCLDWLNDTVRLSGCQGGASNQKFMLPSAWLPAIEEVHDVFISEKK